MGNKANKDISRTGSTLDSDSIVRRSFSAGMVKNKHCPVCLEDFDSNEKMSIFICKHAVCIKCFEVMKNNDRFKCPLCRFDICSVKEMLKDKLNESTRLSMNEAKTPLEPNKLKFMTIGDPKSGKSQLFETFFGKRCISLSAANMTFATKSMKVNKKHVSVEVWDFLKNGSCKKFLVEAFSNVSGVILCLDLTSRSSLENASRWLMEIYTKGSPDAKIILVGTKSDLKLERKIEHEEARAFADLNQMPYAELDTSNKVEVEDIFKRLTRWVVCNNINPSIIELPAENRKISWLEKLSVCGCKTNDPDDYDSRVSRVRV